MEKFHIFMDWSVNTKLSQWNNDNGPVQYSLDRQDYHATTNVFQQITVQFYTMAKPLHIKQFAVYGIQW